MITHSDSEIVPPTGFDPFAFWMRHKNKIIAYAALSLLASLAFAAWKITNLRKLAEARQLFAQADTEEDYRQIARKFPRTVPAGNATLLLAEKLRGAKKYDEAIVALRTMIDQYPDYPFIDGAWLSLAATLEAQGKTDEALSAYQQVVSNYPDRSSAPQALLAQAEILKSKGKADDAKRAFENVKSQFPDSYFAQEAMQELQLMKK